MNETAQDRVDALTEEQCRQILVRIIRTIECEGSRWEPCVESELHDWSLLELHPNRVRE